MERTAISNATVEPAAFTGRHAQAGAPATGAAARGLRVALVYFNAGGGHRAAAQALHAALARDHPGWDVHLVDLFAVLDPDGWFRRLTGFPPEAYYNKRLATGFTLGLRQELKLLQAMIRAAHPQLLGRLIGHWREHPADLIVSLVPNFNRALGESVSQACPSAPFVTIMTDLADLPPHFWVEPGATQHLICGTGKAASQALAQGIDPSRVHRTSGMLLRPSFYAPPSEDRAAARLALGFAPDVPVGVVMFGGEGSGTMKRIVRDLSDRPLIVLCGRNARLAEALRKMPAQAPRAIVGHTDDVARWLRLGDWFIGKPGPGSLSEALHCGLPVITVCNAWTMPQERWNTVWIEENRLGVVLPGLAHLRTGVALLIERLPQWRETVGLQHNRALFEVPRMLAAIVSEAQSARSVQPGPISISSA
ncbi:MAG: galactosyldiacylglycerol synthase [Burkholderiales bacterium]